MKILSVSLLIASSLAAFAGDCECVTTGNSIEKHPADRWEFTLESGYLWETGSNTSINYEIVPTQFTFRSPAMFTWFEKEDGSRVVVRNRFALITESITQGPEDYYIGLSAAPSLEYWFPGAKTSIFCSVGGGIGLTDSTYVYDGLGQDFTLNWFAQVGVRHEIAKNLSILGGAYFTHHSNGGMTSPNPGIDATGFTVGVGWQF